MTKIEERNPASREGSTTFARINGEHMFIIGVAVYIYMYIRIEIPSHLLPHTSRGSYEKY